MKPEKPTKRSSYRPYGITPDEAKVVGRIRVMKQTLGLTAIAARLNADGVMSPRGLEWNAHAVMNILHMDALRRRNAGTPQAPDPGPVLRPISKRK